MIDKSSSLVFHWELAWAAQTAAVLEADAPKVGNVNRYYDFQDATLADFHLSALAIGKPFGDLAKYSVGKLIYESVVATRKHVATNTNLGIILLLAPLAKAWHQLTLANQLGEKNENLLELWKNETVRVLRKLTVGDSRETYRAIRLATPSGMGEVPEEDVFQEEKPRITLLEAMAWAKDRDMVARQYVDNFYQVFDMGYPYLRNLREQGTSLLLTIAQTHLFLLSEYPDTLISRKVGVIMGERVQKKAGQALVEGGFLTAKGREQVELFDDWLRKDGHRLNPGATADLMTAIIFVYLLLNRQIGSESRG